MEVSIEETGKNSIKVVVEGEGHTLLNLLRKRLNDRKDVKIAFYTVPHPLFEKVELSIDAANSDPKKLLKETVSDIKAELSDFEKAWKKAAK